MDKLLIIFIILLAIIVIILLITLCYFLYRYLKVIEKKEVDTVDKKLEGFKKKVPSEILGEIKTAHKKYNLSGQFCLDHPEVPAKGKCSISNEVYCDLCITKENDIRIARKYLSLFLDSDWEETYFLNDEEVGALKIDELIKVKKELWSNESIPVITQKQFKINIETDEIETFTVMMTRPMDSQKIKERFGFLD